MDERAFRRNKMQWVNALSHECEIRPTTFRIAYLIADHQNRTVGFAWPSLASLAKKICMTTKSVHRAVDQLEETGWLEVERKANCSNRYRLRWPPGRKPLPAPAGRKVDRNVPAERQRCPSGRDASVGRTYLPNQPKTFLSGLGEEGFGERFKDRGKYEAEIVRKYGSKMVELFHELDKIDATAVEQLCRKAKNGSLTSLDISAAQLSVVQNQGSL
ncbi:helix-turn-helix domain-containing protein [Bradyrhizobium sp. 156]|uniref:helix-turn-helix domain-containing protein n=1 Tax=Bradyrhizobium sp. 156 TaxID=2782630 RepID=UPI001FF94069|nr:helix-turn-helix domain-containing protein [Bradyrhizobium sp. 156]MCK1326653.1 helix-turn-helix domain-containing protein [Bradyrhizobium sp. 156]